MTDKILGVYFPKDADLYAQRQTNIYEQFLKALEAIIFGIRGSNMPITPSVIKKAEIEFERHKQIAIDLLSEGDMLYPFENAKFLEALYVRENRFFEANKATFLSAIKFGSLEVYHLFEAHGGFGLLAQQKSTEIRWTIRSANGSKLDACKAFYVDHRDFAYQTFIDMIVEENPDATEFGVTFEDPIMLAFNTEAIKRKDLADRNNERRKKFFHVGSNNWISGAGK